MSVAISKVSKTYNQHGYERFNFELSVTAEDLRDFKASAKLLRAMSIAANSLTETGWPVKVPVGAVDFSETNYLSEAL